MYWSGIGLLIIFGLIEIEGIGVIAGLFNLIAALILVMVVVHLIQGRNSL